MNPHHEHHIVRIRRKTTRSCYLGKAVYKYSRYELTIPAKYKDLAETFMNKDFTIEAKQEGNKLVIEPRPVESPVTTHVDQEARSLERPYDTQARDALLKKLLPLQSNQQLY
jgi:hypothetical protein